jgi:hypothetical protein
MRVEWPAVDKVWTLSTLLSPDKLAMSARCVVRRKQLSEEDRRREFAFGMSSPQLLAMNERGQRDPERVNVHTLKQKPL